LMTTRIALAAEALQVFLNRIDTTGALSADLAWTVNTLSVSPDPPSPQGQTSTRSWFDRLQGELSWMGDYGSWQSATAVFLSPETSLLPSVRSTLSPTFLDAFILAVTQSSPPTSAAGARQAAAVYWDDASWSTASPPGGLVPHKSTD